MAVTTEEDRLPLFSVEAAVREARPEVAQVVRGARTVQVAPAVEELLEAVVLPAAGKHCSIL